MELVKNIFFNTDKLVPNSIVKISYTGKFFQDTSKKVILHYGFNSEWIDVAEKEMLKTELGFQTEVNLKEYKTFNFCFKNENEEWDNNEGKDYIFTIEYPETALVAINDELSITPVKHLRKSYIWSKKVRLAIYKILIFFPKLISGNYKRKTKGQLDNN